MASAIQTVVAFARSVFVVVRHHHQQPYRWIYIAIIMEDTFLSHPKKQKPKTTNGGHLTLGFHQIFELVVCFGCC